MNQAENLSQSLLNLSIFADEELLKFQTDLKNSINQAEQFRVKERIGIMRRAGVSDRGISEKLGINLVEVRKATFELISMREISPGIRTRGKNLEFEAFCDQVKSLRSHSYTNVEIADELSCSVRKVNRAIRRLIMRNEVEPRFRSRRQIRRKREAIRIQNQIAELWNNTDLTGQQIAAMLGISMDSLRYNLWVLHGTGKAVKKTEVYLTEKKKEKLRQVLNQITLNPQDKPLSIWKINEIYFPNTDLRTLRRLCEEISEEQEPHLLEK